jgi:hypothetical protein
VEEVLLQERRAEGAMNINTIPVVETAIIGPVS